MPNIAINGIPSTYVNGGLPYSPPGQSIPWTPYAGYTNDGGRAWAAANAGRPTIPDFLLPYGPGGGGRGARATPRSSFGGSYADSLAGAQASYGQTLAGYTGQSYGGPGDYGSLYASLEAGLRGSEGSARQGIYDDYQRHLGSGRQSLISRGLNNTTVRDSVERGILADKWRADNALSDQTSQRLAAFQAQIGLAGLGQQAQDIQQQNQLALEYARLAQAQRQFDANLANQNRTQISTGGGYSGGGGGGGGRGYQPFQSPHDIAGVSPSLSGAYGGLASENPAGGGYGGWGGYPGYGYGGMTYGNGLIGPPFVDYGQTLTLGDYDFSGGGDLPSYGAF